MPFQAKWLGRTAMSVTVRLGEIVGLGSKVQNASVTLTSNETRFAFRAAATVGGLAQLTGRMGRVTFSSISSGAQLSPE